MSEEIVAWDGISKNGQYDIYEVHEDERGLMLKLSFTYDAEGLRTSKTVNEEKI